MTPPSVRAVTSSSAGHGLGQDGQRVVARRGERIRKTLQHTDIGVVDGARLAVQQFRCAVDGAAERHPDGLVAEAHAQQRGLRRGARPHQRDRRAGALGGAGSRAQQHAVEVRGGLGDIGVGGQAGVVVAPDLRVHTELAQVLDQVEHEAVVIVDDQDLHQPRLLGVPGRLLGELDAGRQAQLRVHVGEVGLHRAR